MPNELDDLKRRVQHLEDLISTGGGIQFEELIRDIVFIAPDNVTATYKSATTNEASPVTALDLNGKQIRVPQNPTKYVKIFFKGQQYNMALYAIA